MDKRKNIDPQCPALSRNFLNSWARELRKNLQISHNNALEIIANHSGYSKWQHFIKNGYIPKRYHPYFTYEILCKLRQEITLWSELNLKKSRLLNAKFLSYEFGRPVSILLRNEVERLSPDEVAFISQIIRDGESTLSDLDMSPYSVDRVLTSIDSTLLTAIHFIKTYYQDSLNSYIYDFRTSTCMYYRINYFSDTINITIPELDSLMPIDKANVLKRKWFPNYISSFIRYTNDSLAESEFNGEISYSKIMNDYLASNSRIANSIAHNLISIGGNYEFFSYDSGRPASIRFNF